MRKKHRMTLFGMIIILTGVWGSEVIQAEETNSLSRGSADRHLRTKKQKQISLAKGMKVGAGPTIPDFVEMPKMKTFHPPKGSINQSAKFYVPKISNPGGKSLKKGKGTAPPKSTKNIPKTPKKQGGKKLSHRETSIPALLPNEFPSVQPIKSDETDTLSSRSNLRTKKEQKISLVKGTKLSRGQSVPDFSKMHKMKTFDPPKGISGSSPKVITKGFVGNNQKSTSAPKDPHPTFKSKKYKVGTNRPGPQRPKNTLSYKSKEGATEKKSSKTQTSFPKTYTTEAPSIESSEYNDENSSNSTSNLQKKKEKIHSLIKGAKLGPGPRKPDFSELPKIKNFKPSKTIPIVSIKQVNKGGNSGKDSQQIPTKSTTNPLLKSGQKTAPMTPTLPKGQKSQKFSKAGNSKKSYKAATLFPTIAPIKSSSKKSAKAQRPTSPSSLHPVFPSAPTFSPHFPSPTPIPGVTAEPQTLYPATGAVTLLPSTPSPFFPTTSTPSMPTFPFPSTRAPTTLLPSLVNPQSSQPSTSHAINSFSPTFQQTTSPSRECNTTIDECCIDTDCSTSEICANRNCIHLGCPQFSLTWTGAQEYYLFVQEPTGAILGVENRSDPISEGVWEGPVFAPERFGHYAENVFFPTTCSAPTGIYKYYVIGPNNTETWNLTVFLNDAVEATASGKGDSLIYEFLFTNAVAAPSAAPTTTCLVSEYECCTDGDCPQGNVCAGRNCVIQGSMRFTLTWFGMGKLSISTQDVSLCRYRHMNCLTSSFLFSADDKNLQVKAPGGIPINTENSVDPVSGGRLQSNILPRVPGYNADNIYFPVDSGILSGMYLIEITGNVTSEPWTITWVLNGTKMSSYSGTELNTSLGIDVSVPPPRCDLLYDECCSDTDCPTNQVCAARNCVMLGYPRFTLTWFGSGKCKINDMGSLSKTLAC